PSACRLPSSPPASDRRGLQPRPPNCAAPPLARARRARFGPAPADGVLPDGFFSTTNLPTYVHTGASWRRPRLPRMDCVIVLQPKANLVVAEPRRVKKRQLVAVGTAEHGGQAILLHADGFHRRRHSATEFRFMPTGVSRAGPR